MAFSTAAHFGCLLAAAALLAGITAALWCLLAPEFGGYGRPPADAAAEVCAEGDDVAACAARDLAGLLRRRLVTAPPGVPTGPEAGRPVEALAGDLHGIHDLLLLGYWGVMTDGPQVEAEMRRRADDLRAASAHNFTHLDMLLPGSQNEGAWEGLAATRGAAVDLAHLLEHLHPVPGCRELFRQNAAAWRESEDAAAEDLVEVQAAAAWSCVGVEESMIKVTCSGMQSPGQSCAGAPITSLRNADGTRKQVLRSEPYRNYVIEGDDSPLGVCRQGPPLESGYASGNTKWLRACSYWTSFHALALRADALGGDYPNQLFGAIVRLVAGGVLWCGG